MKKFLLPIIFALAMTNAFSANCYWVGGGTVATPSDWYTAANWSTNSVPGSGDVAIFDGRANNLNPYVSIGGYSINIAGLQVYPATGATANNVLSLVGNSSPFTITGDLTINTVKPASTQYNGQISDNGNNTISEWEVGMYQPRGTSTKLLSIVAERAKFKYSAGTTGNKPDTKE